MSQRDSGYERAELDNYATPHWVTYALFEHLPPISGAVWECARGSGQMADALGTAFDVIGSDIVDGIDFLKVAPPRSATAIVTNPPFALAVKFIERALELDTIQVVA